MKNSWCEKLIAWYTVHKRDLPWRQTIDPYRVWLSEIILQQTRVDQGMPYYLKFVNKYQDVFGLAAAPEDEVLKLWQGLGYYSRARNMQAAARAVVIDFGGEFPRHFSEIRKLKGVGDYTAAAIASFCFNEPRAVVDGNVYRVLSRVFGIDAPINSTKGIKIFRETADSLLCTEAPGIYNQAIMEFGALQCVPRSPDCGSCIFNKECIAFRTGRVDKLPVKTGKTKIRKRYFNYLVYIDDDMVLMQKRTGKDIWENLYEFPLVETDSETLEGRLMQEQAARYGLDTVSALRLAKYSHKLSHQTIEASFWIVKKKNQKVLNLQNSSIFEISLSKLGEMGTSRLIEKFLTEQNIGS